MMEKTEKTEKTTAKERTVTGGPVARFIFNNHSVFELVCKIVIMSVIIPWGSVFLNGVIVRLFFSEVFSTSLWMPVAIIVIMFGLLILGIVLSVMSIVRFSKKVKTVKKIKTVSR